MSGFQEMLTIAAIVLGIIFIPRLLPGRTVQRQESQIRGLSFNMRLAVAGSLIFPAVVAVIVKPWEGNPLNFVICGAGPVAVGWLAGWVVAARKKR